VAIRHAVELTLVFPGVLARPADFSTGPQAARFLVPPDTMAESGQCRAARQRAPRLLEFAFQIGRKIRNSRWWELNPQPRLYESRALPLSYIGGTPGQIIEDNAYHA
jgi:hypothetical protein